MGRAAGLVPRALLINAQIEAPPPQPASACFINLAEVEKSMPAHLFPDEARLGLRYGSEWVFPVGASDIIS